MVRYLFYTIGDLTYQSPLVDNAVQNTNNYIFILPKFSRENDLTVTDKTEIQVFICLLCLAGARRSEKKESGRIVGH